MYLGLGIFLLVVGAVLAFATSIHVSGIDLSLVGWILMAGACWPSSCRSRCRGGAGSRRARWCSATP